MQGIGVDFHIFLGFFPLSQMNKEPSTMISEVSLSCPLDASPIAAHKC